MGWSRLEQGHRSGQGTLQEKAITPVPLGSSPSPRPPTPADTPETCLPLPRGWGGWHPCSVGRGQGCGRLGGQRKGVGNKVILVKDPSLPQVQVGTGTELGPEWAWQAWRAWGSWRPLTHRAVLPQGLDAARVVVLDTAARVPLQVPLAQHQLLDLPVLPDAG